MLASCPGMDMVGGWPPREEKYSHRLHESAINLTRFASRQVEQSTTLTFGPVTTCCTPRWEKQRRTQCSKRQAFHMEQKCPGPTLRHKSEGALPGSYLPELRVQQQ